MAPALRPISKHDDGEGIDVSEVGKSASGDGHEQEHTAAFSADGSGSVLRNLLCEQQKIYTWR